MSVERFDLGDGNWADIRNDGLHKTVYQVDMALARSKWAFENGKTIPDQDAAIILAMVPEWHVVHDGQEVPLSAEGIDNAPGKLIANLFGRCMEIHWEAATDSLPPLPSGISAT
jgi:hypothetical protein